MFAYAIIHNGNGDFIICQKNQLGYFFHNKNGPGGKVFFKGVPLKAPGSTCFPGGEPPPQATNPVDGALAELREELDIALTATQAIPLYYTGTYVHHNNTYDYYGVYFHVGQNYNAVLADVHTRLNNGQRAATEVSRGGFYKQYNRLIQYYAPCPVDNEINRAADWNIFYNRAQIAALNVYPTDWFYNMIIHLQQELFRVSIYALNGQLAGIAKSMAILPQGEYSLDYILFDPILLTIGGQYNLSDHGTPFNGLRLAQAPTQRGVAIFE